MYQVHKDGQPVGKLYPTRQQALIEAYERKYINDSPHGGVIQDGVEIKEL